MSEYSRTKVFRYNVQGSGRALPKDWEVRCPAGERIEGIAPEHAGCHCRIEKYALQLSTEPRSLTVFCANNYTACPTWRANKDEGAWEGRRSSIQNPDLM